LKLLRRPEQAPPRQDSCCQPSSAPDWCFYHSYRAAIGINELNVVIIIDLHPRPCKSSSLRFPLCSLVRIVSTLKSFRAAHMHRTWIRSCYTNLSPTCAVYSCIDRWQPCIPPPPSTHARKRAEPAEQPCVPTYFASLMTSSWHHPCFMAVLL
jgi:hypothetical protein